MNINDLIFNDKISLKDIINNQNTESVWNYEVRDQEGCQYSNNDNQMNAYFKSIDDYTKVLVPKEWIASYNPKNKKDENEIRGQYFNETLTEAVYVAKDSLPYQWLLRHFANGSVARFNKIGKKIIKGFAPVHNSTAKLNGFFATIPQGNYSSFLDLFKSLKDYNSVFLLNEVTNLSDLPPQVVKNNEKLLNKYYKHDKVEDAKDKKMFANL